MFLSHVRSRSFPVVSLRVGKIAIERGLKIARLRIHRGVKGFHFAMTPGDDVERLLELREVVRGDADVEFAEFAWTEAEFSPPQRKTRNAPLLLKRAEIRVDRPGELEVLA